eukprot:CAMPEP_0181092522 /NCGR_PEP_ID=MMETSP1071-20121207/8962_1 /TAXON_ID=35127 /ORGANISM="Thalassiosira sp., Strain NH16" /LENGTH=725 /DNA_ID=CAMNT_0023174705 /DNA_START=246 /DNA_END=2423 /DNA_ORIENTATION=+
MAALHRCRGQVVDVSAALEIVDHHRLLGKAKAEEKSGEVEKASGEVKSEKTLVKKWEDDDDDDDDSVSIAIGEKQESTSKPPEDDEDDDDDSVKIKSPAAENTYVADIKIAGNVSDSSSGGYDGKEGEGLLGQTDGNEGKDTSSKLPNEDDDDDATVQTKIQTESSVKVGNPNAAASDSFAANGEGGTIQEGTTAKTVWPEDDDDDDDVDKASGNVPNQSTDSNVVAGEPNAITDNLVFSGTDAPPTAYHRNQSSEAPVLEDESALGEGEKLTTGEPEQEFALGGEDGGGTSAGNDIGGDNSSGVDVPDKLASDENINVMGGENSGNIEGGEISIPAEGTAPMDGTIPNEGNVNANIPGPEQNIEQPIQNHMTWEDDEEEDSFFEMVQATFNVILLAAFLTSLLVFRKRVMDRVNEDSSLTVPIAMKDELIDVVIRLATWAANRARDAAENGSGAGHSNTALGAAGNSRGSSYGPETIPLSTATDEEWGWEDDDMGTNLELSGGMRAGGADDAKEDDDLAMAIAMSLSESQNGGDEAKAMTSVSVPKRGVTTPSRKPIIKKPLTRPSNTNSSTFNTTHKDRDQTQRVPAMPIQPMTSSSEPSASAGGDSIEDLLGQMGGTGGPMITSFGQKPKLTPKSKSTPKKKSGDDIFASMGLSSFPSKAAAGAPSKPAPASGGWQAPAKTQPKISAPKSAPSPSLLADTLDDDIDGDSWGDDGDLDDLLDD